MTFFLEKPIMTFYFVIFQKMSAPIANQNRTTLGGVDLHLLADHNQATI